MAESIMGDIEITQELLDEVVDLTYPDALRPSKEKIEFQSYVLTKHAFIENIINLLLSAYFTSGEAPLSAKMTDIVMTEIDISKKFTMLLKLNLIDQGAYKLLHKVNNYRKAQAHYKEQNQLRDPSNFTNFQDVSVKASSALLCELMRRSKPVARLALKNINNHLKKKGIAERATLEDVIK